MPQILRLRTASCAQDDIAPESGNAQPVLGKRAVYRYDKIWHICLVNQCIVVMIKDEFVDRFLEAKVISEIEELYYYTTLDTFINGIIRKGEFALWAGHVDYMEDKQEFEKGLSIVKSIDVLDPAVALNIGSAKNIFPYQLSLSMAKDCYPMWHIYGKGMLSVMLIIDAKLLKSNLKDRYARLGECIYEGTEEGRLAEQFVEDLTNVDMHSRLPNNHKYNEFISLFPYLYKDSQYNCEKEVRIFNSVRDDDAEYMRFKRVGNVVKPFKEMNFSSEVLKGIMLGPCSEDVYRMNAESLNMMLRINGFDHVRLVYPDDILQMSRNCILKSGITIRG